MIATSCEVLIPISGQGKRDGCQEQEVCPFDPTMGWEDFEGRKVGNEMI